ncbi:tRNA (guanosine(46)-N7)-methyltransferase TrmB [Idiomarina sp. UBA4206]|uniref:tRNA (guanosine(46)-N7)-methyltransferase TrmB n=1 Tax=Idiomarina sp. UBA4206 TaxID=1946644 RepID=UPI00257EDD45|nr:tRNA (guanosine(46)-N7)-methyltransferase TrmB [Idiomarina sp. UBA4206]
MIEDGIKDERRPLRRIRSFVLRTGRMTKGQELAYERYWPDAGLQLADGMIDPEAVFGRRAPLVFEIGFGMGQSLLEMAQRESDKDFIGVEVHRPGVGRLLMGMGEAGLNNLRAYCDDAVEVLQQCIPDASLNRVQIYFPDPWHKKKHHKRRILQSAFVQQLRPKIAGGGMFHMATDWQAYAEHMLEVMSAAPGFTTEFTETGYAPRPDYRPITKFEKRGERLGHGVWDLLYKKTP